jgi:transketolase
MGDGEVSEGSVWEAAAFASNYKLDNLIAIVDVNRLGQSAPTSLQHHTDIYENRFKGFGWHTIVIDGHNVEEIIKAFYEARTIKDQPVCIVSKTYKGKYFTEEIEDKMNWHGKPITSKSDTVIKHITTLMTNPDITLTTHEPKFEKKWEELVSNSNYKLSFNYDKSKQVSTREAYGQALKHLGEQDKYDHIIALDCDVKNSTMSEYYEKVYPNKFINCFISEQNMISVALGVASRNKIPFCSTFGAFYSRAFDQIRMGAISFGNVKFFGSHSGIHIGPDGPSQMALEVNY